MALDLVGFGIVLPVLPLYAERFGATPAVAGALVASFSVAQFAFAPLWGRISDRVGRKPVLIVSLVGTAVGSLLTGLAGSLWVLFAGRLIDGASGASVSVAQASVADVAAPADRPRLLGLLGAAFGLGFVAGPALGSLGALIGPSVPFFIAAALASANAVVAWRRLPETHPSPGSTPPAEVPERHPFRLAGGFADLALVAFVATSAFSAFEATFALFGERRLGLRLTTTGLTFAGIGLLIVAVQAGLVHRVAARVGEATTLRIGLVCNVAGLALLTGGRRWPVVVVALVLLTTGQGLLVPTLSSIVAGRAGAARRGAALGVQQAAGGLARVVGPLAGGLLFEHVGDGAPFAAGAVIVLLALVAARRVTDAPAAA